MRRLNVHVERVVIEAGAAVPAHAGALAEHLQRTLASDLREPGDAASLCASIERAVHSALGATNRRIR